MCESISQVYVDATKGTECCVKTNDWKIGETLLI